MEDYRKAFLLSLFVFVLFGSLLKFPQDDGLRHVGLGFANGKSWGEVYPYSAFETFQDYDPWFGYDLLLRKVAAVLHYLPFSPFVYQFWLTKLLAFLFMSAFLYLILTRSGILQEITDGHTFFLAYSILLVLLIQPLLRFSLIRPFAFGTLYLLYAVGQEGILKGFLSAAILTFLYPYLAWFYTLPVACAHLWKGHKKFALGTLLLTGFFFALQPSSFWGFQLALFQSDLVRKVLHLKITEFYSLISHLFFFLFYVVGFLILYPSFSKEVKRLNCQHLLILFYLLPALKYTRYFLDILLPLLFLSFGRETVRVLLEPFQRVTSYWGQTLLSGLHRLKFLRIRTSKEGTSLSLKPYLAVLYAIVLALVIHLNYKEFSSWKEFPTSLSPIPQGALALTDFNSQYKLLYVRPDLHLIPSCEVGFVEESIQKEYIEFFNAGKVCPLAQKTQAQFFLESKGMYLDPQNVQCLELVQTSEVFNVWKISSSSDQLSLNMSRKDQ